MAEIALRNVCKQFDSTHYDVKGFTLDISDKEFVIFVDLPAVEIYNT